MLRTDEAAAQDMYGEIGSLEPGKIADVISLDQNSANLRPRTVLAHRIVHYADGSDVSFVMVDGDLLAYDREFDGIDREQIFIDAERVAQETMERAGVEEALEPGPNF